MTREVLSIGRRKKYPPAVEIGLCRELPLASPPGLVPPVDRMEFCCCEISSCY
jgi:hypothetical protein